MRHASIADGSDERGSTQPCGPRLALQSGAANHIQFEPFARNRPGPRVPATCRQTSPARPARAAAISRATAMPGYRCPPVPPPAITTAGACARGRPHRAIQPSRLLAAERPVGRATAVAAAVADDCCEMLSSIPMATMLIRSDDPPLLTNGSGMPLVGSELRDDADVHERLQRDHHRDAEREERSEPIRRERATTRRPRHAISANAAEHHRRADEAQFLADHRVDEVGVRLREGSRASRRRPSAPCRTHRRIATAIQVNG